MPPDMLAAIKQKVSSGSYESTSELIRDAMRLWQKTEEEHEARISLMQARLEQSRKIGEQMTEQAPENPVGQQLLDYINSQKQ